MSTENNSESNSKRSRYEMESSQSSNSSSLLIVSDEINVVDNNQNVLKRFREQNEISDDENSSKLLDMMLEIKIMRSQLKILTKRMDDIQVERAAGAGYTTNIDSLTTASVDFLELDVALDTIDDVNKFESKLKSKDFKTVVLNSLLRIGGTTGTMDANKVVRTVFSTLFDEEVKRNYTWTGRGGKAAFKDLHEIRKLIFEVVVQADLKYSLMQCDNDITQKLLKSKRPSTGRAPLDLSRATGFSRIVYSPAVTPTRLLNQNAEVSEAWSYLFGSVSSQVN